MLVIAAVAAGVVLVRLLLRTLYAEKLRFERKRYKAFFAERLKFEKARRELDVPPTSGENGQPGRRAPRRAGAHA